MYKRQEYAFEGEKLADDHSAPSVFTEALVQGLSTGEADRDEDGWVSLNELYEYVFDRVRTSTPGQTPTRDVEMQGELYLARSRRKRVQASPVPPDLLAASHDANVFSRLGAVSELRNRLLGGNLPAAAGAHQRLAEMAELDLRYVADAAAEAIRDAALHVHPTELDAGQLLQGSPSPPLHVTMTGPPLAQTYAVEPSDVRIRVVPDTEGLAITLDTTSMGRVDGTVTVRGPLGEHAVRVRAEVTAPEQASPTPSPDVDVPVRARGDELRDQVRPTRAASAPSAAAGSGPAEPVALRPRLATPPPHYTSGTPALVRVQAVPAARDAPDEVVDDEPPTPGVAPEPSAHHARWLTVGVGLAVAGALLLGLGAFGDLRWEAKMRERDPSWFRHTLVLAVLLASAAAAVLVPRTRWTVGPGLLLGVLVASTWNLPVALTEWLVVADGEGGFETGFWLVLLGHVVLLAAGVVVVRAVSAGAGFRVGEPEIPWWLVWALLAVGAAGAAAVAVSATRDDGAALYWVIPAWAALTVAAVPVVVAFGHPAEFRLWLLTGWVVGAAAAVVRYVELSDTVGATYDARAAVWIGVAVAALLPLAVVLGWRAATDRDAEQPVDAVIDTEQLP